MQIQLLKDNKSIVPGKKLGKGFTLAVINEIGKKLVDSGEAKEVNPGESLKKLNVALENLNK